MPKVPPSTPPRQNADRLNRDDRSRIITLRDAGHSYQQIIDHLDVTYNQVQFTFMNRKLTPRKARGKLPKLSDEKVDEIIAWYTASEGNHSLPYRRVIQEFALGVSEDVLVRALRRSGFGVVRLWIRQSKQYKYGGLVADRDRRVKCYRGQGLDSSARCADGYVVPVVRSRLD